MFVEGGAAEGGPGSCFCRDDVHGRLQQLLAGSLVPDLEPALVSSEPQGSSVTASVIGALVGMEPALARSKSGE